MSLDGEPRSVVVGVSLYKAVLHTAGIFGSVLATGHVAGIYGLSAWNIALLGWVVGYLVMKGVEGITTQSLTRTTEVDG